MQVSGVLWIIYIDSLFLYNWHNRIAIAMPKLVPTIPETQTLSYYQLAKKRFNDEITRIREKYELNNIVLVLDLPSAKIISTLFTVIQLVDKGIVFVQRLEKIRKKIDHHAIYFISPTEESIELMLKDFQSSSDPQYRKVHVLLTSSLEQRLMKEISKSTNFLKKLARHSFKQFYCEVEIISDNCLHFGLPYLELAYSKESSKQKEMRFLIGKKMVDLIAGFPKLHTIRFLYDKDNSVNKVASRVVERAAKEVKNYLRRLLDASSSAIDPSAPDLTFLVVDRSIDIITPLLHGYSYEGLLYDILDQNGTLQFQPNKLPKDIFDEYRYKHLSYVLSELPQRLNDLLVKVNNSKQKKNVLQIKGMVEQKQKLNEHVELLHKLWSKYQEKNIREVGELELCFATGVTEDGKQTSSTELVNQAKTLIKNNTTLNRHQLLRIGLLILSCVKVSKEDYQNILDLFKEEDQRALKNLVAFGITYDKKVAKSTKNIDKTTMDRARQLLNTKSISSERFSSVLQITLPRLIDILKKDDESRNRMGEIVVSVSGQQDRPPKFDQKRMVCFMCGGLSQTEICSIRRNSQLNDVLLASDMIVTPNSFVRSLKSIDIL